MKRKHFFLLFIISAISIPASAQINSSTYGMMEARYLGPGTMSGRITDIAGVNNDGGKTIYVGTAGGGIWKSNNAGFSFKPIFDKYVQSIGALAIDQKNPKTIYAGTGESNMRNTVSIGNGMYKSTDGGDNWTKIGLDSTEHISKVLIDPSNSSVIYVSAPGPLWSDSKHRGLYKSNDAGKTWEKILYINEKAGVADVEMDPQNTNVLYATTWEFRRLPYAFNSGGNGSGIYKSTDAGKTWKELTNGLPKKPFGRVAIALAPSAPQNLWAIVESENTGLYISSDGGATWKEQSATANIRSRPFYFSTLEVDPKDAKRVYRPAFSFAYSNDGGYSFAEASNEGGWIHSDHHALWINPNNTNILYLGTDGGVYYSLDKGVNWKFVNNLPVGQFYHVNTDDQQPYRVYGGLQDNGSWVAPSSIAGGVMNGDWKSIYGGDGFWVQPDPENPQYAYAEYQGGNMARVHITEGTSINIKPQAVSGDDPLRFNWNTPLLAGAKNPKNLYTAAQYLYKSTNKGASWEKISPDLTTNDKKKQEQEKSGGLSMDVTSAENHCTIFTIAESPLDENLIWVGTDDGNVQYTADGGKTWNNVTKNVTAAGIPAGAWVSSIEPSAFDNKTVYASFENHMYGDHNTYAAVSKDGGATWTRFKSEEFTGFAHKIKEDILSKNLIFLGTEMGLFASVNGGQNWFRMKLNLPWYALVRDIHIQRQTGDLLLATHGRGIIVIQDISPMRKINESVAAEPVVMLNDQPMGLTNGKYGGSFPNASGDWNGGTANTIPFIEYYLKERANSIQLEVTDMNGKLLQKLTASNRKGYNRSLWNQRMMPPKIAKGGNQTEQAAFSALQVLPGNYLLKLKVNGKEYVKQIQMIHDASNEFFTEKDRLLQYEKGMELFAMNEDLAVLVDSVLLYQGELQKKIDAQTSKKAKSVLQKQWDAVEKFRLTLVPPVVKGIADLKRLRNEIGDLYAAIVSQEAAPGNLQIQKISALQTALKKAKADFATLRRPTK
ncbi:MAG: glycoside hydrolase [Bacteroidetes bacterium]|nr:glycoside hydrolase [Bacteroidota bacterium]